MAGQATLIGSGIVSGLGLLLAAGYVGVRAFGSRSTSRGLYDDRALSACHRRRSLAAGLVAAISVAFFVGANFLDARRHPMIFMGYWTVVLGLVLWLCVLAVIDIRHARRASERHLADAARKVAQTLDDLQQGGES